MATLYQGILGGFSGKVGTVVGAIWKGIAVIRGYNPNVTNPNSPAQLEQRAKFRLIVAFLHPLVSFLRVGFQYATDKTTAFNEAMKANFKVAITGSYPAFDIDYNKAILAKGNLAPALNPTAVSAVAGKVDLTWDDNSGEGGLATDTAMIVVYSPLSGKAISTTTGPARSSGAATITVPDAMTGDQCHVYMGFKGTDSVSNCTYVDTVVIA